MTEDEKLEALLDKFEIKRDSHGKWKQLALALAREHVWQDEPPETDGDRWENTELEGGIRAMKLVIPRGGRTGPDPHVLQDFVIYSALEFARSHKQNISNAAALVANALGKDTEYIRTTYYRIKKSPKRLCRVIACEILSESSALVLPPKV